MVKNFIFSSTAAVYKEGQYKVSENSIVKPKSVYGKTKIKAENLIMSYSKKNKINYIVVEPNKRSIVKKSYADNFLK